MIPIKLIFKGLYSYKDEQTIHFGPLMDGQIFGIFGSVGSGKSSILDAITYALYGETERLNQRDNRNYNMMNLQSNVMEIDFEFENFNQKKYRFVVLAKRHGSRFDEVHTPKRSAYQWDGHQWIPIEANSAESIIGLSYQNFKRTIIIPQNKFQEFLQLGVSDRTRMMKEIFHLEKYELSGKVSYLEKMNHEKKIRLETRLTQFEGISDKWMTKKASHIATLEKQLSGKKEHHKQEQEKLDILNQSKKQTEELALAQQELTKLEDQFIHVQQKKKALDQYEYVLEHFKKVIDADQAIKLAIEQNQMEKESLKQSIASLQVDIKSYAQKESEIIFHIDNKDKYQDQARELLQWNDILELEKQMSIQQARIDQGKKEVEKVGIQLSALNEENAELEALVSDLKKDSPNLETMSLLQQWFQTLQMLEKQIEQFDTESKALSDHEAEAKMGLDGLFTGNEKLSIEFQRKKTKNAHIVDLFHIWKHELQSEADLEINRLQHLNMQSQLSEWTDMIKDGAPCPLCGATDHPEVLQVESVKADLSATNLKIKKLKQDIHQVDHGLQKAIKVKEQLGQIQKQKKQLTDKRKSNLDQLHQHKTNYQWDQILPQVVERWESFRQLINQKQKEIQSKEERLISIQKEVKTLQGNQEKYRNGLQVIEHNLIDLKASIATLVKGLSELTDRNQLDLTISLTDQSKRLNVLVRENDKQYDLITKKLQHTKQNLAAAHAELGRNEKQLKELATRSKKNLDFLNKQLIDSPFEKLDQVNEVLNLKMNLSRTREEIQRYTNETAILQNQIKKLMDEVSKNPYDHKLFKELTEKVLSLTRELEETQASLIKEQAELEREKKNLIEKKSLNKELQQVDARGSDILLLKKLFKGSGFVNYISSVFLKNLCWAANTRFYQLTRQQYKLELTEKNEFVVRDFLNDGKIRSVKTLSGGQTFQASLSLALALAESVQQQNKANQNFFFLDEGFGALDKSALDIVFETLKSLRKENRIVGVISHVDDLQREIDVFLKVENHPEKGSYLCPSWEN